MLEDSGFFKLSSLLQGFISSDLLDHLGSTKPVTFICAGFLFRGVIDAGKETNKKEKLKMGRKKRQEARYWCPSMSLDGGYFRQPGVYVGKGVPHRGDILRRDDATKLDKTRWERISKFSMKRILGPEGDQL